MFETVIVIGLKHFFDGAPNPKKIDVNSVFKGCGCFARTSPEVIGVPYKVKDRERTARKEEGKEAKIAEQRRQMKQNWLKWLDRIALAINILVSFGLSIFLAKEYLS